MKDSINPLQYPPLMKDSMNPLHYPPLMKDSINPLQLLLLLLLKKIGNARPGEGD